MLIDAVSFAFVLLSLIIVLYHHIGYPMLLHRFASARRSLATAGAGGEVFPARTTLPTVTMIVPVYNEALVLDAKIKNIAALDYPRNRLTVVIVLDGCTDASRSIAEKAVAHCTDLDIHLIEYPQNRGKIAVLNDRIAAADTEIVALSDASSILQPNSIARAVRHFFDPNVGVLCAGYRISAPNGEGERAYWKYQTTIKTDESTLSAPMGAHGAFYLFRRPLWRPLPVDTINDDFVLPMQIVLGGSRAVYDPSITATEIERTTAKLEFRRRVRIGAGNMQQLWRLAALAAPQRGWLAFLFLSGKGLRPLIPFVGLVALLALIQLAWSAPTPTYRALLLMLVVAPFVAVTLRSHMRPAPKPIQWLSYFVEGHLASLIGAVGFLCGRHRKPWSASPAQHAPIDAFVPVRVAVAKRACDIVIALIALPILAVLFVPIAVAIKLSSPGPVLYWQSRVGRVRGSGMHIFRLIKFRTMRKDAEANLGPVWATTDDPRVTSIGRYLRKSHLDELPQIINVLRGDMSIVGPRPERPNFTVILEETIPFYSDRTFGLRPGITGLAQTKVKYDTCLGDAREKVMYDHAYAARLGAVTDMLRIDCVILVKTMYLVFTGQGH